MPDKWRAFVFRYDPDTAIVDDIDTPQERVRFLQDVAQTFLIKGSVKLNIKRLYAADSKAIREILKVANLLYKASLQTKVDAGVCAISTPDMIDAECSIELSYRNIFDLVHLKCSLLLLLSFLVL
jgi:hypothetical protein